MFGATTNFPFNFANRVGIPMIESNSVTSDGTNAIINIPNRACKFLNCTGLILFRLNTAIPTDAASLPILFSSNNFTQPLTLAGGDSATGEQMTGPGVYLIYYAKGSNLMQLMTYGPTAAVTKSTSSTNG